MTAQQVKNTHCMVSIFLFFNQTSFWPVKLFDLPGDLTTKPEQSKILIFAGFVVFSPVLVAL